MDRDEVERTVWKTMTLAVAQAKRSVDAGIMPRASREDVDLILATVDAYAATIRRRHALGKRAVHYAPMPAIKTACGVVNPTSKALRITGRPEDVECENCKATERWKHDMASEERVYG